MTEELKEISLTIEEREKLEALGYRNYINLCSQESARALYEEKKELGLFQNLGVY